ncbi:MAG: cobalt chelatase [Paenibacillaceae bacterium]|jgi:cobalt/nickel transport system ATP-binding protein|nr:cobalt chelatase [Paenibacillaceae bacterium]
MRATILEAVNLHYKYADGTSALSGVNLKVQRGEKLAVMGANGSGKSTFFLCLNGVYKPSGGTVYLDGEPVQYTGKGLLALRRRVGIVFQDPDHQLFSADVYGEISFGPLNLGLPEDEVRRRVENVIGELQIGPFQDKPVHFLSGGQKKRVSIADILVMEPDVVILDEPAAALDPKHARLVDEIIDGLSARGITVIISTHDVNRALAWADAVALFDGGQVLTKDTPQVVFGNGELLRRTNLEQPTVMKLFHSLTERGILDRNQPIPRSEDELAAYINEATFPVMQS